MIIKNSNYFHDTQTGFCIERKSETEILIRDEKGNNVIVDHDTSLDADIVFQKIFRAYENKEPVVLIDVT